MESSPGHAFPKKTEAYFRERINLALQGLKLSIENNHQNEPKFLEDLQEVDKRTGGRGGELEKHKIIMSRYEKEKEDLEAALKRLDDGVFGFCQYPGCNEVISFARLDAIPQAKYDLMHQAEISKTSVPRKAFTQVFTSSHRSKAIFKVERVGHPTIV